MHKKFALMSALLIVVVIGGCNLITGTFVVDLQIEKEEIISQGEFQFFAVDLTKEDTWKEHQDKIKNIDNIGFQLWVENNGNSDVTWEFYADNSSDIFNSVSEIKSKAKNVLIGLVLPANKTTYIDWPTSLIYLNSKEFPTFKDWVENGKFNIYAIGDPVSASIIIDSARVIVTVTAGP
jgi:hypothetical protein